MKKKTIKVTFNELQELVETFMLAWINNDAIKYPNLDKMLFKNMRKYRNIRDKWINQNKLNKNYENQ